jgi:hypothetical protein
MTYPSIEAMNWLIEHWIDVVVAIVLAVVCAILVDLLRVSSRVREGARWVKDKAAKSSVTRVNQRIAEQEKYRNTLQGYLGSDKLIYLAMLRSIVGLLLFMCIAGAILILGRLGLIVFPGTELMAFGALAIAIAAGVSTIQFGSFDSSKMLELINKIDSEILALKETRLKLER